MQYFLFCFLYFILCGLNPGHTKVVHNVQINPISDEYSLQKAFQCETDLECESLITGSKCISQLCKCPEETLLSSDATKCLTPAKEFGSSCEDNVQCSNLLSSGGICNNNRCACKPGYHYLKGHCWKNVNLNEECFKDEQCFSSYEYVGFKCKNKVCKCRENYYERLNSGCRRKRNLGESCNLDEDCGGLGKCESMKCAQAEAITILSNKTVREVRNIRTCSEGMFVSNEECFLELGMQCSSNSECSHIKNAICLDSMCACEPILYIANEDNRKCLKVTRGKVDDIYKSSCNSDPQCGVFGANSYCEDKRCACRSGSYFEVNNKFCWSIKALGEKCTRDEDCNPTAAHAECGKEKICVCKNGYHSKDLECVPDALKVGDPCENDQECLFPNSFCNSANTCACKKHFYLENNQCKPGVGTVCEADQDCAHLNNTICDLQLKQCLCKSNYTSSNDYKYCLSVADYKQNCSESFQCELLLGDLGECKDNICECQDKSHYFYGRCHKSKFVGQTCSKLQDCFPGNDTNSVLCMKGFCACNYDYELDEMKICLKTNSATTTRFYSMLLTSFAVFLTFR